MHLLFCMLCFVGLQFTILIPAAMAEPQSDLTKRLQALPLNPPHLDLEASSQELKASLMQNNFYLQKAPPTIQTAEFQQILDVGQRNLDWLIYINRFRKEPLQFTKPGTLRGIPIAAPRYYSDMIVIREFAELSAILLPEMKVILLEKKAFTQQPPADVENYLLLGRKIDRLYQTALRWQTMQPYLTWLALRRQSDVRGFYFLSKTPDLEQKLKQYEKLSAEEQNNLKAWLQMQCYNSKANDALCNREFENAYTNKNLVGFYQSYLNAAERNYNSFFRLQNPRSDFSWKTDPSQTSHLAIYQSIKNEQKTFLQFNLEDEWHYKDWQLKIDFTQDALTSVSWQPGITPHVNAIGGSSVYMNSDAPLSEWDVQWTIRHEFGHVFGLPDCYIEFYDTNEKAIVSYQIDVDDLMCSRAGKMNERIYNELANAYRR